MEEPDALAEPETGFAVDFDFTFDFAGTFGEGGMAGRGDTQFVVTENPAALAAGLKTLIDDLDKMASGAIYGADGED